MILSTKNTKGTKKTFFYITLKVSGNSAMSISCLSCFFVDKLFSLFAGNIQYDLQTGDMSGSGYGIHYAAIHAQGRAGCG